MKMITTILLSLLTLWYKCTLRLLMFFLPKGYVKRRFTDTLRKAGVTVNGSNPWDIQVKNEQFYERSLLDGGHAFSYPDGWWECDDIEGLEHRIWKHLDSVTLKYQCFLQSPHPYFSVNRTDALRVAHEHYDIGNDLYASMLDPTMNYSCGYWRTATDLDQAQLDKMDLIARKLMLKPGMRVLDLGCGWGSLAKYLAENHQVSVVGVNISMEQVKLARQLSIGLPGVEYRLQDYRDVDEKFDRVVSVGFIEHVGLGNYRTLFEVVDRCLVDDGIFLAHFIGINHQNMPRVHPWTNQVIFPNSMVPYIRHVTKYAEGLFIMEDWHNFGFDYSRTLRAWMENFDKAWPKLSTKYGEKFYRVWSLYLKCSAGLFSSRKLQLWQIVFTKDGLENGYESQR